MKVCFLIYDLGSGGAERTVAYLSNYAVTHETQVDIVVYGDSKTIYNIDEKVNIIKLDVNYAKTIKSKIKRVFNAFENYRNISKAFNNYVKTNNPDVIFCMLSDSILYALKAKKKVPIIGSERSNPYWTTSFIQKFKRKYLFNKLDGIVFQTQRAQDFYVKSVKNPIKVVIPNAVGNDLVYSTEYNPSNYQHKIGAVGSLRAQKDYPTMINAFKKFKQSHSDYVLEIFGDGKDKDNLIQLTKDLQLDDSVIFKGIHNDALKQISNHAFYVMSSISEGMPNALMEAMAIGMPCISTDCNNGPAELINNNENGILVPIQDVDALCNAMCKMADDRQFAEKCGQNAKMLKETNSVDTISKKYFEFIQNIINKRK